MWRALSRRAQLSARRSFTSNSDSGVVSGAISALYSRGRSRLANQPRAVVAVTGGGGHLVSWMLSEPGATKCLLEALVPYDKNSCLEFLSKHERVEKSQGIGFCSPEMAILLASAARDRALALTPFLDQWPDCVGVASTATIVSHYQRRGGYRCHAACVDSSGEGKHYTHNMVKGEREREGEDAACALLTLRALMEGVGEEEHARALEVFGLRLVDDETKVNKVGERAVGVEGVPEAIRFEEKGLKSPMAKVLISSRDGSTYRELVAPSMLPQESIIGIQCKNAVTTIRAASWALHALGRKGDEGRRSWNTPPAPVFFNMNEGEDLSLFLDEVKTGTHNDASKFLPYLNAFHGKVSNWAVLATNVLGDPSERLRQCVRLYPSATFVSSIETIVSFVEFLVESGASGTAIDRGYKNAAIKAVVSGAKFVAVEGNNPETIDLYYEAIESLPDSTLKQAFQLLERGPIVLVNDLGVEGFTDGSPSTESVTSLYSGEWDEKRGRPHGSGIMQWENGITYEGEWCDGLYHGQGGKLYSNGGGYVGQWISGKREGWGTSLYDGKWGYDRWEGPFKNDVPHGVGTMYKVDQSVEHPAKVEFEAFDVDHNGFLDEDETVGRLCGKYGMRRVDAEALFRACDENGDGLIGIDEFLKSYDLLVTKVGGDFPIRPDQLPPFEFVDGKPVTREE
jgi:hypothetical protein